MQGAFVALSNGNIVSVVLCNESDVACTLKMNVRLVTVALYN